jgi:hypothetical protein
MKARNTYFPAEALRRKAGFDKIRELSRNGCEATDGPANTGKELATLFFYHETQGGFFGTLSFPVFLISTFTS